MFTNKAAAELAAWAEAVKNSDRTTASQHLQQFRHLGASLMASKEFRERFEQQHECKIGEDDLECLCRFLSAIAEIEEEQIEEFGPA